MLVAFGIFAVIMVIAVGSLLSLLEANYRARAFKVVVNNLHFAFENMSRNLRTGSVYHCDAKKDTAREPIRKPRDCATKGAESIVFTAHDGTRIVYEKIGTAIMRAMMPLKDGRYGDIKAHDYLPITAPEIEVARLKFYVAGSESSDDHEQPRVLIVASGVIKNLKGKEKTKTPFNIQTLVSQRLLDIP